MSDKQELKPCPFCGSTDIDPEFWLNGEGKSGPGCMECGATGPSIEVWNTRASQAQGAEPVGSFEAPTPGHRNWYDWAGTLQPAKPAVPEEWREAVQEFVDRVDRGEVRSRYTYKKFKSLLAAAPQPGEGHNHEG